MADPLIALRTGGSPLRVAVAVLAGFALAVVGTAALAAAWPWEALVQRNVVIALQHAVIFAYLVGACLWVEQRASLGLRTLAISGTNFMTKPPRTGFIAAVLIGLGAGVLGPWLAEPSQSGPLYWWRIQDWTPLVAWHRVLSLLIGIALALFANVVVQVSRRLSRLAMGDTSIDAFNADRQRPFIEQGLTHGASVAGLLCLVSLLVIDHGANPMLLAVVAAGAVLTVLAVLLPLRGVRFRIRTAKVRLLAACDAEIEAFAQALEHARPGPPAGRIADLVAFRSQVERIREWPFDTPAIRRVVVYALLPLFSWFATVAAQPYVEAWLGVG